MDKIIPSDLRLATMFLTNLADMRDEEFRQKCLKDYQQTFKPARYLNWESYYHALSTSPAPTSTGQPSGEA